MDITGEEKQYREKLLGKCYEYLYDNFHKFSDTNKIRIALELVKRRLPQDTNLNVKSEGFKMIIERANGVQGKTETISG